MIKFDDLTLRDPDIGDELTASREGELIRDYSGMLHTVKRIKTNTINLAFAFLTYVEYAALYNHYIRTGADVFVYTDYSGVQHQVQYMPGSLTFVTRNGGYSTSLSLLEIQYVGDYYVG